LLLLFVAGCQTLPAPIDDYALARAAMDAARSVQGARHSPGYWHQAEEAYRRARILYKDREYSEAKEEFIKSRVAAERAENSARLIRQKSGDVL
jgi:hypothetical protein